MDTTDKVIYNLTVKLLFLGLIITLLKVAQPVLLPLAVAILFSFLLMPISQKLEDWKVPRGLAIVISLFVAVLVVAGLMYFFYSQILLFVNDWPELSKQMSAKIDKIYAFINEKFNYSEVEQKNWISERLQSAGSSAASYALGIFSATGSFIASIALLPIFIFFLTYYRDKYKHFVELMADDEEKAGKALEIIKKITRVSQKYLKGLFLVIVILSILNSTGFLLLGLRHAILFGVLLAMLNIIPYIGILIGSIFPIMMALITEDQIGIAIGVLGVTVFVQFLENNFITPNVVGSSVSINPFTAILGLTTSALIWGIIGMIIALPFIGMMKVAFDHIGPLKPWGYLMGEEKNYKHDSKDNRRKFFLRNIYKKNGKKNS